MFVTYGTTYVYDHQLIAKGNVNIVARDGDMFHIIADGQDLNEKEFKIDAIARFKGVYVDGSEKDTQESIDARLKQFLDLSTLVGSPFKLENEYGSGVKMGQSFFKPKLDRDGK